MLPSGRRETYGARLRVGDLAEIIPDASLLRRSRAGGATEADSTRPPFLPCAFNGFLYALHTILITPDGNSEMLATAGRYVCSQRTALNQRTSSGMKKKWTSSATNPKM